MEGEASVDPGAAFEFISTPYQGGHCSPARRQGGSHGSPGGHAWRRKVRVACPGGWRLLFHIATANANSWLGCKELLASTSAMLVFVQETKLMAAEVPDASAWAARMGWQPLLAPCGKGPAGGAGFSMGGAGKKAHVCRAAHCRRHKTARGRDIEWVAVLSCRPCLI